MKTGKPTTAHPTLGGGGRCMYPPSVSNLSGNITNQSRGFSLTSSANNRQPTSSTSPPSELAAKLTPPKPVVVVPNTQCTVSSKRSGLPGGLRQGWGVGSKSNRSNSEDPSGVTLNEAAKSGGGGLAALLRVSSETPDNQKAFSANRELGAIPSPSGNSEPQNDSKVNEIEEESGCQAFPTLNAVKLQGERVKEEHRLRNEARRLQQLQRNKEEKELQERKGRLSVTSVNESNVSPDFLSNVRFARQSVNEESKEDESDNFPDPLSTTTTLTAALSSSIASCPSVTIRSVSQQPVDGKEGAGRSVSAWSSSSHLSTAIASRESAGGGPSSLSILHTDHSIFNRSNHQKSTTAFPGLDEAVTLISQQEKEEARHRKRQKEGQFKKQVNETIDVFGESVSNIPKSLASTIGTPGLNVPLRWADAEMDDDELMNLNYRSLNSQPDGIRPDPHKDHVGSNSSSSSLPSSFSFSKPLTGIMSQFVSFRPLQPIAVPLEPLTYNNKLQWSPSNQKSKPPVTSHQSSSFQSQNPAIFSLPNNSHPFKPCSNQYNYNPPPPPTSLTSHSHSLPASSPAMQASKSIERVTSDIAFVSNQCSNEPLWRESRQLDSSSIIHCYHHQLKSISSSLPSTQHLSYDVYGPLVQRLHQSDSPSHEIRITNEPCSHQSFNGLEDTNGHEIFQNPRPAELQPKQEINRLPYIPPSPPSSLPKPRLIVDKAEILRKMEERRLEEEVRVKEQEEASRRKLEELEKRFPSERRKEISPKPSVKTVVSATPVPDTFPTFSFSQKKRNRNLYGSNSSSHPQDGNNGESEDDLVIPLHNAPLKDLLGIAITQTISVVSSDAIDESRSTLPAAQPKASIWHPPSADKSTEDQSVTVSVSNGLNIKEGYDTIGVRWKDLRIRQLVADEDSTMYEHTSEHQYSDKAKLHLNISASTLECQPQISEDVEAYTSSKDDSSPVSRTSNTNNNNSPSAYGIVPSGRCWSSNKNDYGIGRQSHSDHQTSHHSFEQRLTRRQPVKRSVDVEGQWRDTTPSASGERSSKAVNGNETMIPSANGGSPEHSCDFLLSSNEGYCQSKEVSTMLSTEPRISQQYGQVTGGQLPRDVSTSTWSKAYQSDSHPDSINPVTSDSRPDSLIARQQSVTFRDESFCTRLQPSIDVISKDYTNHPMSQQRCFTCYCNAAVNDPSRSHPPSFDSQQTCQPCSTCYVEAEHQPPCDVSLLHIRHCNNINTPSGSVYFGEIERDEALLRRENQSIETSQAGLSNRKLQADGSLTSSQSTLHQQQQLFHFYHQLQNPSYHSNGPAAAYPSYHQQPTPYVFNPLFATALPAYAPGYHPSAATSSCDHQHVTPSCQLSDIQHRHMQFPDSDKQTYLQNEPQNTPSQQQPLKQSVAIRSRDSSLRSSGGRADFQVEDNPSRVYLGNPVMAQEIADIWERPQHSDNQNRHLEPIEPHYRDTTGNDKPMQPSTGIQHKNPSISGPSKASTKRVTSPRRETSSSHQHRCRPLESLNTPESPVMLSDNPPIGPYDQCQQRSLNQRQSRQQQSTMTFLDQQQQTHVLHNFTGQSSTIDDDDGNVNTYRKESLASHESTSNMVFMQHAPCPQHLSPTSGHISPSLQATASTTAATAVGHGRSPYLPVNIHPKEGGPHGVIWFIPDHQSSTDNGKPAFVPNFSTGGMSTPVPTPPPCQLHPGSPYNLDHCQSYQHQPRKLTSHHAQPMHPMIEDSQCTLRQQQQIVMVVSNTGDGNTSVSPSQLQPIPVLAGGQLQQVQPHPRYQQLKFSHLSEPSIMPERCYAGGSGRGVGTASSDYQRYRHPSFNPQSINPSNNQPRRNAQPLRHAGTPGGAMKSVHNPSTSSGMYPNNPNFRLSSNRVTIRNGQ